jgi:hypothetical protein
MIAEVAFDLVEESAGQMGNSEFIVEASVIKCWWSSTCQGPPVMGSSGNLCTLVAFHCIHDSCGAEILGKLGYVMLQGDAQFHVLEPASMQ